MALWAGIKSTSIHHLSNHHQGAIRVALSGNKERINVSIDA
jgi:hypothetical protein